MILLRSLLIVPSLQPKLLEKAARSAADGLMIELEDGVHPSRKAEARTAVAKFLRTAEFGQKEVMVRINSVYGSEGQEDLHELVAAGVLNIMLAEVRGPRDLAIAADLLERAEHASGREINSVGLWSMVETAAAVQNVDAISKMPRLRGLAFGGGDLSCELRVRRIGIGGDRVIWDYPFEHLYAKERVVVAARAAGLKVIDTGWANMHDEDGTRHCARASAQLGFDGSFVISPRQLPPVHGEFTPSERDIEWARKVVAADEEAHAVGETVRVVEGQMTDGPFVRSAYQILERAKEAEARAAALTELQQRALEPAK
ncbi:CoA ester lyase [Frankia sp. CNm7]|uniref:CoA ester lyase n=1 Tax=Frankia nepalensis TaxID=1836974 RepID=A0A937UQR2_9ACTN|nr:CoA ester lyase [Frankia nepalensis]MBL7499163.1 CoA ester lyase [Frankia nepalensis]MBL7511019.1 CoA ester lyase [Frankia nepalensis]MBL7520513.1 CoA ester lyase [Frankia nepalensis]MBL7632099.1 CoA ester lyase [Frankia nepalensis]